ncbi:3-oxoacyl-ACP reductase FabG [Buchnera aphidicola (Neophyllaphis varicolor)]|uniref:3-oxoacyl-ACP reductase FabG n=1 Tax=Buchnera aphidicola TaxID=9 RepID=UPI0031B899CC
MALVTGATRGIGKSIAQNLTKSNFFVIGTSTNKEGVKQISNYLQNNGCGLILQLEKIQSIDNIFKKFTNIDVLINNAGIICDKLITNMNIEDWNKVIDINLKSVFYLSKNVIKHMSKNNYGRIINISSISGFTGNVGQSNYSASKAGIVGFTKSIALEVALKGITVNNVSPGLINTNLTKKLTNKQKIKFISKIPMKRFGNVQEVADLILFLVSKKSSYITGQTIHINGGMYMT